MVYLAQDNDFKNENGQYVYIGNEKEIEIPEYINGELVTSTTFMFNTRSGATPVTKVVLKHDHVTKMFGMFAYFKSSAPLLDLSTFNTSNVTDMSSMFRYSDYSGMLDLSGFDTKNVTNMKDMFVGNKNATTLDLSSFDMSNVADTINMFNGCENLKEVYVRTKEDGDKLKAKATANKISPKFYIREPVEFDFDIWLGNYNIESIFLKDKNGKLNELKAYRTKLVE